VTFLPREVGGNCEISGMWYRRMFAGNVKRLTCILTGDGTALRGLSLVRWLFKRCTARFGMTRLRVFSSWNIILQ
jgi:hypothetical protein